MAARVVAVLLLLLYSPPESAARSWPLAIQPAMNASCVSLEAGQAFFQLGNPTSAPVARQESVPDADKNENPDEPTGGIPPALQEYMGRRIADTMSYHGAPWLIRQEREDEERCSLLLANLGLKPGMTVCDLGCGNGFYSLPLARLIGDDGRVLAVDIQPEMLIELREKAERESIDNIIPILGSVHDPRLPNRSVDLILLVDVYHEFSHPVQMLDRMKASLKPGGRIALVEFRAEDDSVPIKQEHKMTKEQILKEFPANGYKLVEEFDKLPWQHLMFFEVDSSATQK